MSIGTSLKGRSADEAPGESRFPTRADGFRSRTRSEPIEHTLKPTEACGCRLRAVARGDLLQHGLRFANFHDARGVVTVGIYGVGLVHAVTWGYATAISYSTNPVHWSDARHVMGQESRRISSRFRVPSRL